MHPEYSQDQLKIVLTLDGNEAYNAALIAMVENGRHHVLQSPMPAKPLYTPDSAYLFLLNSMCRLCPRVWSSGSANSMSDAD
jgi:hypothetical protein